ncbi:MAG: TIGR02449 family protein [Alteromonadaceae bacterium]|nr:MAG: TIGR02449 family protein [Alteromonadaceae bacterium]
MADQLAMQVEHKLDALIQHCQRLERDNAELTAREKILLQERTLLKDKNEIAKTRVEAMIKHLKSLESES